MPPVYVFHVSGGVRAVPYQHSTRHCCITCHPAARGGRNLSGVRRMRGQSAIQRLQSRWHAQLPTMHHVQLRPGWLHSVFRMPGVQRGLRAVRLCHDDSALLSTVSSFGRRRHLQLRGTPLRELPIQLVHYRNQLYLRSQLRVHQWPVLALPPGNVLLLPVSPVSCYRHHSGMRRVPCQLLLRRRYKYSGILSYWDHLPQPWDVTAQPVSSRLLLPNHWTGYPLPPRVLLPLWIFNCHFLSDQHMGNQYWTGHRGSGVPQYVRSSPRMSSWSIH